MLNSVEGRCQVHEYGSRFHALLWCNLCVCKYSHYLVCRGYLVSKACFISGDKIRNFEVLIKFFFFFFAITVSQTFAIIFVKVIGL